MRCQIPLSPLSFHCPGQAVGCEPPATQSFCHTSFRLLALCLPPQPVRDASPNSFLCTSCGKTMSIFKLFGFLHSIDILLSKKTFFIPLARSQISSRLVMLDHVKRAVCTNLTGPVEKRTPSSHPLIMQNVSGWGRCHSC